MGERDRGGGGRRRRALRPHQRRGVVPAAGRVRLQVRRRQLLAVWRVVSVRRRMVSGVRVAYVRCDVLVEPLRARLLVRLRRQAHVREHQCGVVHDRARRGRRCGARDERLLLPRMCIRPAAVLAWSELVVVVLRPRLRRLALWCHETVPSH